ncbi:hypothetical protein KY290_010644 [Solanum tuberosum]|uniref:DUF4283 domain-containing protein n=1 Tax=Solanum tuberosum TaxID=4113 RepID=A0ABQ7W108_SOLTU|nr:hypothetical protein KY290_010644 [Solanum tuberosum]
MAEECKFTINGRFLKTRSQIETIQADLKGAIKIGVYDNRNVFIDIYNEEDFRTVYFKHVTEIDGQPMWLSRCTPDFTLEEDSPLTLVWVLLPKLPFHLHTWHYVKQIVSPIGTPMPMDLATKGRTRPSMAKKQQEKDALKARKEIKAKNKEEIATKDLEIQKVLLTEQAPERGRDLQTSKGRNTILLRGKRSPPKQIYKPIGAIFGIDKPHPTNEVTKQDKGKEKVLDHNLAPKRRKELTFRQIKQLCRRGLQICTTKEISNGEGNKQSLNSNTDEKDLDQPSQINAPQTNKEGRNQSLINVVQEVSQQGKMIEVTKQWLTPKKKFQHTKALPNYPKTTSKIYE